MKFPSFARPGSGGEADPLSPRSSSQADQQPEGRAGQQGETHHRPAGVRLKLNSSRSNRKIPLPDLPLSYSGGFKPTFLFQPEPEAHAGAGEAPGGAREAQIGRPGEESQAARAHVCFTLTFVGASHRLLFERLNVALQRDAGQTRAGPAGPEGTGRDSGEFICSCWCPRLGPG